MFRAIMVAVDYTDLLAISLPWNRHHFDSVTVVTDSKGSKDATLKSLCYQYDVTLYSTDAFYDNGADFNKWKALEQGLDFIGREGFLCVMDADILWPRTISENAIQMEGFLCTPLRRMMTDIAGLTSDTIPPESEWSKFPLHRNLAEWAGYSQIFHSQDPVLGKPPWHETNWRHAGGADSLFQAKWANTRKFRPSWECLHLGPAGQNWCGRASTYVNGTNPREAHKRRNKVTDYVKRRVPGVGRFDHEKLPRPNQG